jgi:hypothetical protein
MAGRWGKSLALARALEDAGFRPALVTRAADVPANAPFVDNARAVYDQQADCSATSLGVLLFVLSAGIVPLFDCDRSGYQFDLHRSGDSLAREVDTTFTSPQYVRGWLAIPLTWLPRYSSTPDFGDARLRLRNALLDGLGETR